MISFEGAPMSIDSARKSLSSAALHGRGAACGDRRAGSGGCGAAEGDMSMAVRGGGDGARGLFFVVRGAVGGIMGG